MKERPILFSGSMVTALLEGRKTQTRRVVQPHRSWYVHSVCDPSGAADPWAVWFHYPDTDRVGHIVNCPYGKPGDRLWVRETLCQYGHFALPLRLIPQVSDVGQRIWGYAADGHPNYQRKVPAIHMPRWASRLTLEIEQVRVERIKDISQEDAKAEGRQCIAHLRGTWNELNEKRGFGWESNPWVWALTFKRVQ